MTPEQLKASILQMAIQGKLVEQRPEEGTAEELYNRMKTGNKVKEIDPDEYPFDIPESWKWVRMGEIGDTNIGLTYKPADKSDKGVIVLRSSNIQNGHMDYADIVKVQCEIPERAMISKGDLLICARNGSRSLVGKAAVVDQDGMAFGAFMAKFNSPINPYIYYFLQSPIFRGQLDGVKTETINQITQDMLKNQVMPLPPIEEQHRIVAKIEELLPYVDRYAEAYEKLEQFNAKFPEDMKKSILQYAIQGKLVEQRPEEGTAEELYQQIQKEKQKLIKEGKIKKEKPLAEITEDEIPFDIPESWKWVRLSEVIDVRDGTHDSPKYVPEGIPLVTSKNLSNGTIDYGNVKYITQSDEDKINERSAVSDADILFAMIGSIGNPVLVKKDREFCIKNMALFKRYADTNIDMNYMYWFFYFVQYSLKAEASGGVQSFISLTRFREYPFPLPPYEEQHRIATKIEELLPYCDRLVK